jgi:hypothetical protein
MAYIATKSFRFGRDFIGVDVITIPSGEVDVDGLGLGEKHIDFLLKEGLIDEVGETETADSAETVVIEIEDSKEEEGEETVEYELEIDPLNVIKGIDDKNDLKAYAEELGIKLNKQRTLSNMKKDFRKAYKPTIETK